MPLHTYLPGPHHGVFNEAAFKNYQDIILCESLIDALTFYANGFYNVTTSFGVNGFTDDLLKAFKNHPIKTVYIAYDRDDAGNKAAEKLAPELAELGIDCYRVKKFNWDEVFAAGLNGGAQEVTARVLGNKGWLERSVLTPSILSSGIFQKTKSRCFANPSTSSRRLVQEMGVWGKD